jgi:hypothetical protein
MSKPQFRIKQQRGKFSCEYLHITKRFLWFDKEEWKPFIHYAGLPDKLFWFESLTSLQNNFLFETHII